MLVFAITMACSKSATSVITGKWNVVSDSTIITEPGIKYDVYHGSNVDYFNFAANGYLYIKESSSLDTIAYQIISADKVLLPGIGFSINGVTEPSSFVVAGNKLRIVSNPPGNIIIPGHQYQRVINLKR